MYVVFSYLDLVICNTIFIDILLVVVCHLYKQPHRYATRRTTSHNVSCHCSDIIEYPAAVEMPEHFGQTKLNTLFNRKKAKKKKDEQKNEVHFSIKWIKTKSIFALL